MKKPIAPVILLLATAIGANAHPGRHHESGLPEISAHFLLGLQYVSVAVAIAVAAAVLYRVFPGKSRKSKHPSDNP